MKTSISLTAFVRARAQVSEMFRRQSPTPLAAACADVMYQELVLDLDGVRNTDNAKAANLSAKCVPPSNPRMRLNAGFCRRYKPPEHPVPLQGN